MKHFRKIIQLLSVAVLAGVPLALAQPLEKASAGTQNVAFTLSPSSGSITKGQTVTVTLNLNSGGNTTITNWWTIIHYDPAYFSPGSIATSGSSPYATPTEADSFSGGNIKISRYSSGAPASPYNGPVATFTLTATAAGSSSLTFEHTCSSTTDTASSCVPECTANPSPPPAYNCINLLATITGTTISIANPPASSGGTTTTGGTSGGTSSGTSKPSSGGTSKPSSGTPSTPTPGTTSPTAPATTTATSNSQTDSQKASVKVTVVDSKGKALEGAKVTIEGVTGTTDKNGKVTLQGVSSGQTTGTIAYKGKKQVISLEVKDGASQPRQSAKFTFKYKKTGSAAPVAISAAAIILLGGLALAILTPSGQGLKKLIGKFPRKPKGPGTPTDPVEPPTMVQPGGTSTPTTPPSTPPSKSAQVEIKPPKRVDPLAPGTTFKPNQGASH